MVEISLARVIWNIWEKYCKTLICENLIFTYMYIRESSDGKIKVIAYYF